LFLLLRIRRPQDGRQEPLDGLLARSTAQLFQPCVFNGLGRAHSAESARHVDAAATGGTALNRSLRLLGLLMRFPTRVVVRSLPRRDRADGRSADTEHFGDLSLREPSFSQQAFDLLYFSHCQHGDTLPIRSLKVLPIPHSNCVHVVGVDPKVAKLRKWFLVIETVEFGQRFSMDLLACVQVVEFVTRWLAFDR
jgi:hypothetical protein